MNVISHEDMLNEIVGIKGSQERINYEMEVKEQVELFNMGEAIKTARLRKGLSQEQLGNLVGVQRSRISQIEKGIGLTLSIISRSLKALDVHTSIVMEGVGSYSLA